MYENKGDESDLGSVSFSSFLNVEILQFVI